MKQFGKRMKLSDKFIPVFSNIAVLLLLGVVLYVVLKGGFGGDEASRVPVCE
jgi:hypothetical protein